MIKLPQLALVLLVEGVEHVQVHYHCDIGVNRDMISIQCPHSKEEDSVATICGFEDEFQYLKV